jgi:hypothetical protein
LNLTEAEPFHEGVRTMTDEPKRIVEMKKVSLPMKVCRVCGDVIARTRRAARDWDHIQYCSAVCRRRGVVQQRAAS